MPKSDDYHLTRSLGFLLADCSRLMRKRFDARARELGLTRAQWRVLGQLRRREGINQTALAEILVGAFGLYPYGYCFVHSGAWSLILNGLAYESNGIRA